MFSKEEIQIFFKILKAFWTVIDWGRIIVIKIAKNLFSSSLKSANTIARITTDGYKGGGEEHCTWCPKMDLNLLATY